MKRLLQQLARQLGYRVERLYGPDITPEQRHMIERVRPWTTTGDDAILALIEATRYVEASRLSGAYVECGVWRGGSLLAIASELRRLGVNDRDLYGFDTFTGMTAPTSADVRYDGRSATDPASMNLYDAPSPEQVAALVTTSGYHSAHVHMVAGPVEETLPAQAPDQIALLRLDTDWHASTLHELTMLYPRLARGGVLIVDDYGHWKGARQAVDEYFATIDRAPLLMRVDYSVRICVKP